jgi:hypothetical protein
MARQRFTTMETHMRNGELLRIELELLETAAALS